MSALSRQMQPLRQKVDQIDLKLLQLLQQRTKLSGQIGQLKRRLGGVVYVPERERELVARLTRLGKGTPSGRVIAAVYREIMSSSRAAQGQAPIGFLLASAPFVLPAVSVCFGACDQFSPKRTWKELADGLKSGAVAVALLTGADLAAALASPRWRREFNAGLKVTGDFTPPFETNVPLAQRIFVVAPHGNCAAPQSNRILILIECKSTQNAIKSLLHAMPDNPIHAVHAEQWTRRPQPAKGPKTTLVRLKLASLTDGGDAARLLLEAGKSAGTPVSILGTYPRVEDYGG